MILDQNYINTKNQVIKAERRVLKELGFCVHVKHPHKVSGSHLQRRTCARLASTHPAPSCFQIIVMYLQVLECEKNQILVQTAW